KFMEKIAMGHVQFHGVDTDSQRSTRGVDELALDLHERRCADGSRRRLMFELRDRGGCQRNPAALVDLDQLAAFPGYARRSLTSGMGELDRFRHRWRVRARDRQTLAQRLLARVVVKAKATERDATGRRHR